MAVIISALDISSGAGSLGGDRIRIKRTRGRVSRPRFRGGRRTAALRAASPPARGLSKTWRGLSSAEASTWHNYAAAWEPAEGPAGARPLTAWSAWVRANAPRLAAGLPLLRTADPAAADSTPWPVLRFTLAPARDALTVEWVEPTPLITGRTQNAIVYLGRNAPRSRNYARPSYAAIASLSIASPFPGLGSPPASIQLPRTIPAGDSLWLGVRALDDAGNATDLGPLPLDEPEQGELEAFRFWRTPQGIGRRVYIVPSQDRYEIVVEVGGNTTRLNAIDDGFPASTIGDLHSFLSIAGDGFGTTTPPPALAARPINQARPYGDTGLTLSQQPQLVTVPA